jgi:hypothetical protein
LCYPVSVLPASFRAALSLAKRTVGDLGLTIGAMSTKGFAILTVDLLPGTRFLWNRVIDEIEPLVHGTEDDLVAEFVGQDLRLVEASECPIPATDVAVKAFVFQKTARR